MAKPVTSEHAKAIAEGLKKYWDKKGRKKEDAKKGSVLRQQYQKAEADIDLRKRQYGTLKEASKAINAKFPMPKKANKAQREKVNAQRKKAKEEIKAAMEKIKVEVKAKRDLQKKLKEQAARAKTSKTAGDNIAKATDKLKKADEIEKKIKDLESKATKPEQKKKVAEMKARLEASRQKIVSYIKQQEAAAKGGVKKKADPFSFSEDVLDLLTHVHLAEKKPMKPWRAFTLQEKRTDFQLLNKTFNDLANDLEIEIKSALDEQTQAALTRVKNKVDNKDIIGIVNMAIINRKAIYDIVNKKLKQAYDVGKQTAAKELDVQRPTTPLFDTQVINARSAMIANDMANDIESVAKRKVLTGLIGGAKTVAIVGAVGAVLAKERQNAINAVTGSLIGEGLNQGRRIVFENEQSKIKAYQRSEILDDRTCNICISLDKTIVAPDDPFVKLDQVHNNCRGVWIPVLQDEDMDGRFGIPSKVLNAFDTVGGTPEVNGFKQLKKPV